MNRPIDFGLFAVGAVVRCASSAFGKHACETGRVLALEEAPPGIVVEWQGGAHEWLSLGAADYELVVVGPVRA